MDRLLYVNAAGFPVSLKKLNDCINDIASGAKGLVDVINDMVNSCEMDEKYNSCLELFKAAAGYINHLACDELLPDTDITEKEYAEFGKPVRRAYDGTPYDEDLAPAKSVERARKGGAK